MDETVRALNIDLPAPPAALARLSALVARDDASVAEMASLIRVDMALAAAVLKSVNSAYFGLAGRISSVEQAITYLGRREVAALTLASALQAVFPAAAELTVLWDRAARRGRLMGQLAGALQLDAWAAHSAGLFEECGKALLFRHATPRYRALLDAQHTDVQLRCAEIDGFGVSHDVLGAALCATWGVDSAAVDSVRHHVTCNLGLALPSGIRDRSICALSALAHIAMTNPGQLADAAGLVAAQMAWHPADVAMAVQAHAHAGRA